MKKLIAVLMSGVLSCPPVVRGPAPPATIPEVTVTQRSPAPDSGDPCL